MAYDPYYQQYQSLRSQEALTGRTNPTSPEALASIIRGNISADQDQQMKQEQISNQKNFNDERIKLSKKEMDQKNMTGAIGGGATLALGLPSAMKSLGIIGGKTAASVAPDASAYATSGVGLTPDVAAAPAVGEAALTGTTATATDALLTGTATGDAVAGTLAPLAAAEAIAAPAEVAAATTAATAAAITAGEVGADVAAGAGLTELLPIIIGIAAWVLCSELVRQGKLAQEIVDQEWEYVKKILTVREYLGYRIIADPIVKLMQRSKVFTWTIAPLIKAFAYEMAYRASGHGKHSYLGSFILKCGLPLCRMAYELKYEGGISWQVS